MNTTRRPSTFRTALSASGVLLALLALPRLAPGQGAASPPELTATHAVSGLSPATLGVASVHTIHMIEEPGSTSGSYVCVLTVAGLTPSAGGAGDLDFLSGSYDPAGDVFTPDASASLLNGPGREFGLSLHHAGLLATYESGNAVWIAERAALGTPFTPLGPVNLPPQAYYDPALATIDGTLNLLFVAYDTIVTVPIELTSLSLGAPTPLVLPARPGSFANSPTPIVDDAGRLVGISHHDLLGTDNDHYLALDLDPTTPSVPAVDTPGWSNNGTFAGGRFYASHAASSSPHVIETGLLWMPSRKARIDEDVFLPAFLPELPLPPIGPPMLVASPGYLPVPLPFPGFVGEIGLDPAILFFFPGTLENGRYGTWLPIPDDPALEGASLATQTLFLLPTRIALTNTAALDVRSAHDCDETITLAVGEEFAYEVGRNVIVTKRLPADRNVCSATERSLMGRVDIMIRGLAVGQTTVDVRWTDVRGNKHHEVICVTVR